jgi:cell cycle checkpoint control protein RAD9A
MLSVFKPRLDDARGKDTAIDRCEVSVQDRPDKTECRFVVKMFSNQGVTKTYKLTYESVEVLHALFDKNAAKNQWCISSGLLREYIEYFGRRTEQLDIYADEERVVFTSFTEKIMNGKEILKQPLQTAVAVNISDFDQFTAQEKMHIIVSVKDFRAIVLHADTLQTRLNAFYTHPTRPLQLNYTSDGMYCEFTLMTAGDYVDTPPASAAPVGPSRATSRATSATTERERSDSRSFKQDMPPPAVPAARTSARTPARRLGNSGAAKKAPSPRSNSPESESLFVGQDDDAQWDPADSRDDEETLGWDASAENVCIRPLK